MGNKWQIKSSYNKRGTKRKVCSNLTNKIVYKNILNGNWNNGKGLKSKNPTSRDVLVVRL